MLDRNGKLVRLGWAAHEMLWLRAAITLPLGPRITAYHDICEMTGRSFRAVQDRANKLRSKQRNDAATIEAARPKFILVPGCKPRGGNSAPPGYFHPSRERLMGCR